MGGKLAQPCGHEHLTRGHRDVVTVVGHAATIAAGEWIPASGEWINDRTHGHAAARSAPTVFVALVKGRTSLMPIGRLLESVSGAQNQRLLRVPANDLEPYR